MMPVLALLALLLQYDDRQCEGIVCLGRAFRSASRYSRPMTRAHHTISGPLLTSTSTDTLRIVPRQKENITNGGLFVDESVFISRPREAYCRA